MTVQRTESTPRIAITIGDPAGIGPEVTLKALERLRGRILPILIGDMGILEYMAGRLNIRLGFRTWKPSERFGNECAVVEVGGLTSPPHFGEIRRDYGRFVWEAIRQAVRLTQEGHADAVVTAPLCKQSLLMAGCPHHGHTELLAELANVERPVMMLANSRLKVALVTTHIPLREVAEKITQESVWETIRITGATFERFGWGRPRLGVLGLNPHAGEQGSVGKEDLEQIAPAVLQAKEHGFLCEGPLPADTAFHRALQGQFDVIVAMYHDQGLGPLKTVSFQDVVNITLGLPFVRVSPGHGTAFDIAGKGIADPTSMIAALETAAGMS